MRPLLLIFIALPACADCPLPSPCDIRDSDCIDATARYVACLTSSDPLPDLPVRAISPEIYEQELRSAYGAPNRIYQEHSEALALLELVDPGTRASDAWIDDAVTHTVAYYSTGGLGITVIDRGLPLDGSDARLLLIHELVHAVQDQRIDLEAYLGTYATDTDRALAARSLIEGGAVLYTDLAALADLGERPDEVDWEDNYATWQENLAALAVDDPSPLIVASQGFPYAFGGDYTQQAWADGGNDAVWSCFAMPPESTAEVMTGYGAPPEPFTLPDLPAPPGDLDAYDPTGWRVAGRWLLEIFLRRLSATPTATAIARQWAGDRLWTFAHPNGERALVWLLHSSDNGERGRELVALVAAAGRTSWRAWTNDEGDTLLVAASDESSLDAWLALGQSALP